MIAVTSSVGATAGHQMGRNRESSVVRGLATNAGVGRYLERSTAFRIFSCGHRTSGNSLATSQIEKGFADPSIRLACLGMLMAGWTRHLALARQGWSIFRRRHTVAAAVGLDAPLSWPRARIAAPIFADLSGFRIAEEGDSQRISRSSSTSTAPITRWQNRGASKSPMCLTRSASSHRSLSRRFGGR